MSWFFCVKDSKGINDFYHDFQKKATSVYKSNNLFIALGGSDSTHHYEFNKETEEGWLVCGVGILTTETTTKLMEFRDWQALLSNDKQVFDKIDGHYAILKFSKAKIELFTDKAGLRDIYIFKSSNTYYFSTRVEWIANYVETSIDFDVFSSRWLLFNQISRKSILKNITRIVAGKYLLVANESGRITYYNFVYKKDSNFDYFMFKDTVENFIKAAFDTEKKVSLSLSGGLDSRVLLSFLMIQKNNNWNCHTFGNPLSPDSIVVKKISKGFKLYHTQYYSHQITQADAIEMVENYASRSLVINPVSVALQMRYYNELRNNDYVVIDGGFGEIWRREFFNKLLVFGKKHLLDGNVDSIIPYLILFKTDIFENDLNEKMRGSCVEQLHELFNEIPDIQKIGVSNWIDILAIITRLANYYSHEQSKTDEIILNYMPFAQPSLLNNILNVKPKSRKNAHLFRKIIHQNINELKKYPLAKNDVIYPYYLGSKLSRLYSITMKKFNRTFADTSRDLLFDTINDFIMDSFTSLDVRNCSFYDKKKIDFLAKEFRNGNKNVYSQIDWWLSFELFRKQIKLKT